VTSATGLWVRAHWRSRRVAILGLVVLTGLAAAVVIASAAGARRTASSFERLRDEARTADAFVSLRTRDPRVVERITTLPMVAESRAVDVIFAAVEGVEEDLGIWVPTDGRDEITVERDRLLRGRRMDPSRPNEVEINELAARVTGADVGDVVHIATLSPAQVEAEEYFPPRGPQVDVEVVGITRGAGDLDAGGEGAFAGGPALAEQLAGQADVFATYIAVRLTPGATVTEFDEAVAGFAPADSGSLSDAVRTEATRDAISALARGLAVFALVAGIATAVIVGQAVGRHVANGAREQELLVALGSTRTSARAALVLSAVPIAVGGAVVAVVAAVLASPLFPIELARQAEPDPGIALDVPVLLLGAAGVALLVLGAAAVSAWWNLRAHARESERPASTIAATVANRVGVGPVSANGIRLALDRSAPAPSVRSSILGLAVAITGAVAVLTFAASLDDLVDSSDRWGQPWDLMLNFTSDSVDDATRQLAEDDRFSSVARLDAGFTFVNGEGVRASGLTPVRGDAGFTLRAGRQPTSPDDVVLGPDTAEQLGVDLGATVEVARNEGAEPASMQVVGIGLFRELDEGDFTQGVGLYGSAFEEHAEAPDEFEAFQLVVRLRPGENLASVEASIDEHFPEALSAESVPNPPRSVGNVDRLRDLLRWFGGFVAALGIASIVHVLATTMRRRRHEFATLRGLGLTRAQVARCLIVQAMTIGVIGLAIGVPFGFIAGRGVWTAVTDSIGVPPGVVPPWVGIVLTCAGALVVAAVLGVPFGRQAGRFRPASALRTE
jgi:cell division protein FtsX